MSEAGVVADAVDIAPSSVVHRSPDCRIRSVMIQQDVPRFQSRTRLDGLGKEASTPISDLQPDTAVRFLPERRTLGTI